MAQDKLEQVIPHDEQLENTEPTLGFARVIRYRAESLGRLRINL